MDWGIQSIMETCSEELNEKIENNDLTNWLEQEKTRCHFENKNEILLTDEIIERYTEKSKETAPLIF